MKNLEEQLKKQAESLRLTDAEKHSVRVALSEHMRAHPIRSVNGSWSHLMLWRFAMPVFAVFLLFIGTTYAAQGTLPGDLLYKIKIYVNEPVQVALTTTTQAKVAVETQLAHRRVEEAQTLAARGTLDTATTQELQENFNAHATEAIALASETDQQPQDTEATSTATTSVVTTAATSSEIHTASTMARMRKDTSPISQLETTLSTQANILDMLRVEAGLRATRAREHGDDREASATSTESTSIPSATSSVDI